VVFWLASFAGGIAQSEAWLISARAVQGLGAAMVAPPALSIITVTFSEGAEAQPRPGDLGGRRRRRRCGRSLPAHAAPRR
jgi:MFS family permease